MSWLLVALIPGLLMAAAIGLERLETGLDDVTELLSSTEEGSRTGQVFAVPHPGYTFASESVVSRN